MPDDPCYYEDRGEKYPRIVHGEMNAILHAREPLQGYTLYVTQPPCTGCTPNIIQSGIARVVALSASHSFTERWADHIDRTKKYFKETGVAYAEF